MLADVAPLAPVTLPLAEAQGCVLAQPLVAPADLPSRAKASRDGYAVRAADLTRCSQAAPLRLPVAAASAPGQSTPAALPAGSVCRVFTGAPLPAHADAVVRHEDAQVVASGADAREQVEFIDPVPAGRFVAGAGSEFAAGAVVLEAGTVLGPAELAVLAATGATTVGVHPPPRVAIIVTGSELRSHAGEGDATQLYASNAVLVAALVRACGGSVASTRIVSDDVQAMTAAFEQALHADLIVSTGGTGRAQRDRIGQVLREREAASMWQRRSSGSRPLSYRLLRRDEHGTQVPHLALAGRPIAASVAFALFAHPLLRHLAGHAVQLPRYVQARLVNLPPAARRVQRFVPVRLQSGAQELQALPTADATLYGLTAALGAHGFALLARGDDAEQDPEPLLRVLIAPWQAGAAAGIIDQARVLRDLAGIAGQSSPAETADVSLR